MTKTDIMKIIDVDDKDLIENKRITNMKRNDWGKTMAVSNQYIQRNILKYMLSPYGYLVYSTDDDDLPEIDISNNSPGFDLIIITPNDKKIRIQSKLRQVDGLTDYSKQIHFETTRRNCEKNKNKNHTGHVCYSVDEFDFVMISLVNDRISRDQIKDCNFWTYCLIPVCDIIDKEKNCCQHYISPTTLKKNIINIEDDILYKFE